VHEPLLLPNNPFIQVTASAVLKLKDCFRYSPSHKFQAYEQVVSWKQHEIET